MWSPVIFTSSPTGIPALGAPRGSKTKGAETWIGAESLELFSGMADLLCGFRQISLSFSLLALKMEKILYSLRSHQQSSLDQQMGGFVWYLLFASQTSLFVRSGVFFAWVSCWNCHRHPSSGHALHILPALWTLIKASGRRSQQHTKYMSVQLFSHAELCLAR